MRSADKHAVWKPTPLVQQVLDAAGKESSAARVISLSVSDPRPSLKQLCSIGPLVGGLANSFAPGSFDISKLPNAQALTEPLFPNVSVVVEDGDALRMDSYSSFALPLDVAGTDTFVVALFGSGFLFRLAN